MYVKGCVTRVVAYDFEDQAEEVETSTHPIVLLHFQIAKLQGGWGRKQVR